MYQDIKNFILKIFSGELTQNQKIFTTLSLAWIILIGYLTWWNGLKALQLIKVLDGMNGFGSELFQQLRLIFFIIFGKKETKLPTWKLMWVQ